LEAAEALLQNGQPRVQLAVDQIKPPERQQVPPEAPGVAALPRDRQTLLVLGARSGRISSIPTEVPERRKRGSDQVKVAECPALRQTGFRKAVGGCVVSLQERHPAGRVLGAADLDWWDIRAVQGQQPVEPVTPLVEVVAALPEAPERRPKAQPGAGITL